MIPFEYRTPKSLKEVHATLREFGGDAKLIAGGTALVIMMKQRLVRLSCLVSLGSVRGLNGIEVKNGGIAIGGLATHRAVETSPLLRRRLPMLADTYHHVATLRVRNMATVGGGLAHADPNQDPPPSLIALGASVKAISASGTRVIPLDEFFKDYYETVLNPDEIITEVRLQLPSGRVGSAYMELARRHGDFAIVGAGGWLALGDDGRVRDARLALIGVGDKAVRSTAAESVLRGGEPGPDLFAKAAEAIDDEIDPIADMHGSSMYRRRAAKVIVRRALERAQARSES